MKPIRLSHAGRASGPIPRRAAAAGVLLLLAGTAAAQSRTDYALNDDRVHFRVPPGWTAVMEKTDGDPQAIAFQVPDESAQGSDDSATVTVKTRHMSDPSAFTNTMQEEIDHATAQSGYEKDTTNRDSSVHQYFVQRAQTRYLVRDSYVQAGDLMVEVRCQRPLLEKTPGAWNRAFDAACAGVVASLKP
ncbi:MAG TPA: hypothetical protein VGC30_09655 [Dokdonella sp.]